MTGTEDTPTQEETAPAEGRPLRGVARHTWSAKGARAVELYRSTLQLQRDLDQVRSEWEAAVADMPPEDTAGYFTRTSKIRAELLPESPQAAEEGGPDGATVQG
jgi:hypothetical protein